MKLKLLLVLPMLLFSFSTLHINVPQFNISKQALKIKTRMYVAKNDIICLTRNIYMEARSESYEGQLAVAAVTLNRVRSHKYPDTICEVVYQRKQFSWTSAAVVHINDQESWNRAYRSAKLAIKNHTKLDQEIMYYHTTAIKPWWSKHFKKVKTIGNHIFYRLK